MTSSPHRCATCEVLPTLPRGAGQLHLWLPSAHGVGKSIAAARRLGVAHQTGEAHGLALTIREEQLPDVTAAVAGALTTLESDDTRVLFVAGDGRPSASDVARVSTLTRFQSLLDSAWLVDLMEQGRFASLFQPIALGEDPSQVVGHEALLRGLDAEGAMVPPARLFDAARRAGLLFPLDLAARRTHIASAHRAALDGMLFLNFTPTAIYDPAMCLRSTVAAIDAAGIAHDRVVFEVVESEVIADTDHLRSILDYYRGAGFRVALDDVGAGYSSLNRLHLLRPDLLKLDLQLVRDVHADPYKAVVAEKVLELADSLSIPVLAEGVETAEELAWLQERHIRYVQGYFIGRPAAEPRAVGALGREASLPSWQVAGAAAFARS